MMRSVLSDNARRDCALFPTIPCVASTSKLLEVYEWSRFDGMGSTKH